MNISLQIPKTAMNVDNLILRFKNTRQTTEYRCRSLQTEDYVVQPITDVSPPKWHLAHSTWFFEYFILTTQQQDYQEFDPQYNYLFNSYYNFKGDRIQRSTRGYMTRPTVQAIYQYRAAITERIVNLLATDPSETVQKLVEIGIHHEQQHQELLSYDIKYILGTQPTFPSYDAESLAPTEANTEEWIDFSAGLYEIGYADNGFCFDNEKPRHKTYIEDFSIRNSLVRNEEYLAFIQDGGYGDHALWHSEAWEYINVEKVNAPLYWHEVDGGWHHYTPSHGLQPLDMKAPVQHISFYEAAAFAEWKGMRLPTEMEWEVAADNIDWGKLWEWTNSAYLPYPGYSKDPGALGEYNSKFMLNQMVLRGASYATPIGHARKTYRNFFHASSRWIFSGIRLAKDHNA